jgi:hypothetical protein
MLLFLRFAIFYFALLGLGATCRAGITSYTDRGKTDFDTFLQLLNPYGAWSRIDGAWAYTPLDHEAPYTDGRWVYTEYGWYWKGALPHSWATEHYGYWKRGADRVWSWYPGPFWLPEIVELRNTSTHIGWRSAAVDRQGDFVEKPEDRYAKTDEWTFVSLAQFANPITSQMVAKPDLAKSLLEDSTDCRHTYVTYREIDRPGPHPADFLALCKDGGMFAPRTLQDRVSAPTSAIVPGLTPGLPAPTAATPVPSTNTASVPTTNVAPHANTDPELASEMRKVPYWITMSLPSFWSTPPPDAKVEEMYLYRPDIYQDEDGIARRIELWLNPNSRKSTSQRLNEVLGGGGLPTVKSDAGTNAASAVPAIPAVPAAPAKAQGPFKSPFDDSFHSESRPPGSSSKIPAPSPSAPEPNAPNAPVPPPVTNAAPTGDR